MFGVPPNILPLVSCIGTFCFWVLLHYMSFKTSAGGFNCAFWWYGALSEDQEKSLMNLPKLSCGFNYVHMPKVGQNEEIVSVCWPFPRKGKRKRHIFDWNNGRYLGSGLQIMCVHVKRVGQTPAILLNHLSTMGPDMKSISMAILLVGNEGIMKILSVASLMGHRKICTVKPRPEAHMDIILFEVFLKNIHLIPQDQIVQWHYL